MRSIILALLLLTCLAMVYMTAAILARALRERRNFSLPLLTTGIALYAGFYLLELTTPTLDTALVMIGFEYIGISAITVSLFLITRDFTGAPRIRWYAVVALAAVPVISTILMMTVRHHQLLYINPRRMPSFGLNVVAFDRGPWYLVNTVYIYTALCYGVLKFALSLNKRKAGMRRLATYMLVGFTVPFAGSALYVAGLTGGIDMAPVALGISAIAFGLGFFRYQLFNIQPLARSAVFEQMRDATLVVDMEGTVLDYNAAAARLFPPLDDTIKAGDRSRTTRILDLVQEGMPDDGSLLNFEPEGQDDIHVEVRLSPITTSGGRGVGQIVTFVDITERIHLEEQLNDSATHDPLTGLPNRRKYYELAATELDRARRHARPIGIAIMDMNDFKEINDTYGHAAGDEALRLAASLCTGALRSADVVARIGGDEFAFIFPECDEEGAEKAAEKVRSVVCAATFTHDGTVIKLCASLGAVGSVGPVHPDLEELVVEADRRMYAEKREIKKRKLREAVRQDGGNSIE